MHSDVCQLGRAVRQGCTLSPLLFNTYIQQPIEEALENIEDGVKVNWFADDQAMVSSSKCWDTKNRRTGQNIKRLRDKDKEEYVQELSYRKQIARRGHLRDLEI